MPRYKEYNEKRVLDIAMREFWKCGFQATSIQQLSTAMKINKNTIYEVFGNKEDLLVKTMLHYKKHYCEELIHQLKTGNAHQETLLNFFEQYFEHMKKNRNSCYILSITTETGISVEAARQVLEVYVNEIEQAFLEIMQRILPNEKPEVIQKKAYQIHHVFLSLMLVSSIRTYEYCIAFTQQTFNLMNLKSPNYA